MRMAVSSPACPIPVGTPSNLLRNLLVFHTNGHLDCLWCLARPVPPATPEFLGKMGTLKNPDSCAVFASKNPHLRNTAGFLK